MTTFPSNAKRRKQAACPSGRSHGHHRIIIGHCPKCGHCIEHTYAVAAHLAACWGPSGTESAAGWLAAHPAVARDYHLRVDDKGRVINGDARQQGWEADSASVAGPARSSGRRGRERAA